MIRKLMICASALLPVTGLAATAAPAFAAEDGGNAELARLSDAFVASQLGYDPTLSYISGLPAPDHRRWADRSPAAILAFRREQDAMLQRLNAIDANTLSATDRRSYALLKEQLESENQARVCKSELWTVSHMDGWQLAAVRIAQAQPVATAAERAQALERWAALPAAIDREIANLRIGLAQDYSAARSVVARVVKQVDGLATAPIDKSPFMSPAQRSEDAAFKAAYRAVIADKVVPALARYRDYLKTEYLPRARTALGVAANPNGASCYQASLRLNTTLNRTAQQVHDIGAAAVARNAAVATDLGEKMFGTRDLGEIVKRVNSAPDNIFGSEEELVAYSRVAVARALAKTPPLFRSMPQQEVLVEPFREFMRGSGASSHYEIQTDPAKPAYYRIGSENWKTETRGGAELTAVHEAYPGHHMQLAFAQTLPQTPLSKISFNSAYIEGWARYSEMLAEEAGMYESRYTPISRRVWPARGMVADPGLHVLGWSREKTIAYLAETGRFGPVEAEDMVDRMASLPGQLTAYDSGGLEIMALREEAKKALGDKFDLRDFHQAVLGAGIVPLGELRTQIERWIAETRSRGL
ncbi:DUF885 domain-containing protein [Sphingosinicella rhizophila]|uniref:DUF885 domain-containing protein n=1 Tax=Sphingosinicella rhizophila TaxID=3050082 RepID=A0ABU3QAX8_9SPHN|nr:DUF885 domain-containing protein [Sphingosinicella sp. GR2756]MDT9600100.1 DUF885 domain-containing protein [Sphingosinicella sp. GR2756]